jgi:hypothetical protein
MKKVLVFTTLAVALFSCNGGSKKDEKKVAEVIPTAVLAKELLQPDFMKTRIFANHGKLAGITGNLQSFKKYLKTLDTNLQAIPYALDYIKTCIHVSDTLQRDSIFFYYMVEIDAILDKLDDSILRQYASTVKAVDSGSKSKEALAFTDNINLCGIELIDDALEGDYLRFNPDFLYNNFQDFVSKDIVEFLDQTGKETTEGFSEDGGLNMSFEDLYKRIKIWEKFANTYPNSLFRNAAWGNYRVYMGALFTGLDNSPVYDYNTQELLPELKTLYEKIIKDDTASKTSHIISEYYDSLSAHGFMRNDSVIGQLERKYKLWNMMAAEPELR